MHFRYATALRVKTKTSLPERTNFNPSASLCRLYRIRVKYHLDLAAKHVEQDCDPFAVGHALEQTKTGREHTVENAYFVAEPERWRLFETNEAAIVFVQANSLDD